MTPEIFRDTEKLYHYTSLKNGTLILLSRALIMSRPSRMNDINESYRPIYSSECEIEDVETEMKKYFQSSFTLDDGKIPGFAIPAMWGHYAEHGKGMCLVFDKKKLLSQIDSCGYKHGTVKYSKKYTSSIIVKRDTKRFIEKHLKTVFFKKSADWAYEREYRVICRAENVPVEIDLSDCLIAIIVHHFDDIAPNDNIVTSPSYKSLVNRTNGMRIPVLVFNSAPLNGQYELIDYVSDPNGVYWYPQQNNYKELDLE